jgi:hypothetical protein
MIFQRFGQRFSCNLHGEFCGVGLGSTYIDLAFGDELEVTDVIVRAVEHVLLHNFPQTSTLNTATEMLAGSLENL